MRFKPIVVVCTKLVPDHDFYPSLIDTILLGISGKTHKPTRSTEAPSIPAGCLGNSSVRTSCQLIPQAVMSWGHALLDWLRNVAVSKESKRKHRHTHSEKRLGGCKRKMVGELIVTNLCHFIITFFWNKKHIVSAWMVHLRSHSCLPLLRHAHWLMHLNFTGSLHTKIRA